MAEISMQDLMPLLLSATTASAQAALRIGLILLAGSLGVRFLRGGLRRLEALLIRTGEVTETDSEAARKRVTTLVSLLRTLATVAIWAVVGVVVLAQLGLDVTPILAGAGIAGLAVGFGAQNLVRDLISGFFLVLENQVRVGDVAIVNGTGGLVEAITFRTIVLRDLAGVVHVFPNGTVNTLSNMTMGWSASVIDIGVSYKENTDRVVAVLKGVAEELREDPAYGPLILEPLEVFGVDHFGESEVIIKVRLKTQPMQQWAIGREYRRRVKQALDAEGIVIPFPHRAITVGEASKPFPVLLTEGSAGAGTTG